MQVTIYKVQFNHDINKYESDVMHNVECLGFDDYTNVISLSGSLNNIRQMKLDTVEIVANDGYLATTSSLTDTECYKRIIDAMIKRSTSIISAETDRLELLSQVSPVV